MFVLYSFTRPDTSQPAAARRPVEASSTMVLSAGVAFMAVSSVALVLLS